MKKILKKFVGVLFCIFFVLMCVNINFYALVEIPNNLNISLSDLEGFNTTNSFGKFIKADINENTITVGGERRKNTSLRLKLFGFLPIKEVSATIVDEEEVYIGGIPLGFSVNTKGLIVVGKNSVNKNSGSNPFKTGDVITHINGEAIEEASDIISILNSNSDKPLSINLLRDNDEKEIVVVPELDKETNQHKLGIWVRDDAQGIGTLTFVKMDGSYGALGHSICDYETGIEIPVKDGGIYMCNLVGINKAQKHKTGELRCLFSQAKEPIGEVNKNTHCGVFGKTEKIETISDQNLTAQIGSRMLVKLGKAKIVSAVSGIREEYEIEIIKAKYQPSSSNKSLVFRVTDKRLINLTGGIVQGMSGSPIIQNNKIIGAVTHVFLNDATKGYGIYLDWMMEQI